MNKTQYLAARAQWKADYYTLQQRIRDGKLALRAAHRIMGSCGAYSYQRGPEHREHNAKWVNANRGVTEALRDRWALRKEMDAHLAALAVLKDEACRAWQAR